MLSRWWDRFPGRLEYELEALRELGVEPTMDEEQRARGRIVLSFLYPVDGAPVALRAVFPALYPFFRFELYAPDLALKHHQNPFEGNLCLIGGATANWLPRDTLAGFLRTQLPQVLATGRSDDAAAARGVEEPQAEPVTTYYTYEPRSLLLVDSSWRIPADAQTGTLTVGLEIARPLRGAVHRVEYAGGHVSADEAIVARHEAAVSGRWFRMPAAVVEQDPTMLLAAIEAVDAEAHWSAWERLDDGMVDIVGIVFPEEIAWRESGDGWVFVVRRQDETRSRADRRKAGARGPTPKPTTALVRAGRYGRADALARIPALTPLGTRAVSVAGTGALGGPIALDLARAGTGMLRLLDGDHVEAGTGVRWPLGLDAAGVDKVEALIQHIRRNWPFTRVEGARWRLGSAPLGDGDELALLDRVLDGCDLLLDATAELGVQQALAGLARELGIPYLFASATNGGWGGLVARLRPTSDACWYCVTLALTDGTIPAPPADPSGGVQPVGCANPTFTGTNFDLAPVSAMATRLTVMTLAPEAYGDVDWDVAVLSLRDREGRVLPGSWAGYRAERHHRCENHGPRR